ncbi:GntR family transcriptional regulator [Curtobacterium sp. VKM Ac-1393]|uniref:GntR family transcriptional regulator n=1 Tax=Curtobacterium sp. VKM Ac-1393 TaxID=2783814 RepID=UPI00188CCB4E|nr:GntR family transcriptional regulator [Curtobacterium sp. VKM Ac-1393]
MASRLLLLASLVESDGVHATPAGKLSLATAPTSRESVRNGLRAAIEHGQLQPGIRLKRAHDLATAIGVSRSTIGAAVMDLVHEGLIERRSTGEKVVRQPPAGPRVTVRPVALTFDGPPLEYADIVAFAAERPRSDLIWKQHHEGRCVAEIRVATDPRWWSPPSRWTWDAPIGPQRDVERVEVAISYDVDSIGTRWLVVVAVFYSENAQCTVTLQLAHGFFSVELV